MAKGPLILAILGVCLAVLGTQVTKLIAENKKTRFDGLYEPLLPDLWRQGYHWVNLGGLFGVDVYVFLIKADGFYILIDTGGPTDDCAELLLKNLDTVMGGGKLKLIILTHGHPDHIGTLSQVVNAHPGVQVAFHEDEAPYILGQKSYGSLPADSLAYKLFMGPSPPSNFSEAVPASRALLLRGQAGDLADAKGPAGNKAQWLPRRGTLSWRHVPGHAPGMVAPSHTPSQSSAPGEDCGQIERKRRDAEGTLETEGY